MKVREKPVNRLEETNGETFAPKVKKSVVMQLVIPKPNAKVLEVEIVGLSEMVQRAWDQKTANQLADKAKGRTPKGREKVDPNEVFNNARYISEEGWDGIPCGAFKAALVDALECAGISKNEFSMKLAKKSFFVLPDGKCKLSGRDLVRIHGKVDRFDLMQPTSGGGPYMSYRPRWKEWKCRLRIRYNATVIDAQGVLNLLATAGDWVGCGEHRPSSKESKTGSNGRWEIKATHGN